MIRVELERHADPFPYLLTSAPHKGELFSVDTYFAEGWRTLREVFPDPLRFSWDFGIVVLRPEAFAGGRAELILDWIDQLGLVPALVQQVSFDRHAIRALWRYQWNLATPDRKALTDRLLQIGPSLLVVVRERTAGDDRRPVTVRLTDAKGPAEVAKREPAHLRSRLGLTSAVLSFVHTADEPADVVRELGIHFTEDERRAVLARLIQRPDATADARAQSGALTAASPVRSLDPRDLGERLLEEVEARGSDGADLARLKAAARALTQGALAEWRILPALARHCGCRLDEWDEIVLSAAHIVANEPGRETWINTRASDWHELAERLQPPSPSSA